MVVKCEYRLYQGSIKFLLITVQKIYRLQREFAGHVTFWSRSTLGLILHMFIYGPILPDKIEQIIILFH